MNTQEKSQLKEWWAKCPNKKIVYLRNIIISIFTIFCVYELGYGFGKFLAHIGL